MPSGRASSRRRGRSIGFRSVTAATLPSAEWSDEAQAGGVRRVPKEMGRAGARVALAHRHARASPRASRACPDCIAAFRLPDSVSGEGAA